MQDGQAASGYHPDRAGKDAEDLELEEETDSETEARTASFGLGLKQPGESDSSIKCFMAKWSSDADSPGDFGAESQPAEQTMAEGKRLRADDAPGTSKVAKKKGKYGAWRSAPDPTAPSLVALCSLAHP